MTSPEQALAHFVEAWNAGRRPRVEAYLEQVPDERRDELADAIATWMALAPEPLYDDEARAAILAEPAVKAAVAAFEADGGTWPALLPRLRERASLGLADAARGLAQALGVGGREEKVRGYLEAMEGGTLDPGGVSRRVLEALAELLGARADDLERAGRGVGAGPAPAVALFRADAEAAPAASLEILETAADALLAPTPEHLDEVDLLFRGGRA